MTYDPTNAGDQSRGAAGQAPAGFCQNCGRPLTTETVRRLGEATLCEPCLTEVSAARAAASGAYPATPVAPSVPNPGLAGLLGFIPGVGAMYNEQYGKGFVHLLVFVVLVALTNADGIFMLFVLGWEFYMAMEAHHTAKARRDGLPLPNPFGLNDIGERLGFGKNWPGGADVGGFTRDAAQAVAQGFGSRSGATAGTPPAGATPWGAPAEAYAAGYPTSGMPGYGAAVSPGGPASYAQSRYDASVPPAAGAPGYAPPPYTAPGTVPPGAAGAYSWNGVHSGPAYDVTDPATPFVPVPPAANRVPTGAIWLIALGAVFLLLTTGRFSGIPGQALLGFGLLGLGGWMFTRCMLNSGSSLRDDGSQIYTWRLFRALRGSSWVMLVGIWFLLGAFHLLSMARSWPLFLILAGLMTLLERTAASRMASGFPVPGPYPAAGAATPGYSPAPAPTASATPAGTSIVPAGESTLRAGFHPDSADDEATGEKGR